MGWRDPETGVFYRRGEIPKHVLANAEGILNAELDAEVERIRASAFRDAQSAIRTAQNAIRLAKQAQRRGFSTFNVHRLHAQTNVNAAYRSLDQYEHARTSGHNTVCALYDQRLVSLGIKNRDPASQ